MKTIRAVFHNGHLWNPDTKQRIVIRDKSEVVITINGDDALHDVDPYNEPPQTLRNSSEQKLEMEAQYLQAHDKHQYFQYRKILDRDSKLYFTINAGIKEKDETLHMKTYFEVTLLEDLYISRRNPKDKQGRTEPCACVVASQLGYNLPYFESVYATSLNDAYSKTFVLYFNIFGKGTANVYDRFYTEPNRSSRYLLKHLRTFTEQMNLTFGT